MLRQSEPQLEKISSAERLKLNTVGRITGLPHIVELRFVRIDNGFYVFAGQANADWVMNALSAQTGKLTLQRWQYSVKVSQAPEEEKIRAYLAFNQKYGSSIVRDWYAKSAPCLKLIQLGPPILKGALRGERETQLDYETWKLTNHGYYRGVAEAFDSASEEYDFTISHNFINTWIRRRSINALLRLAKSKDVLVEVGCGTGAEASTIAPHVLRIIATDISDKMLQILRLKIQARRLEGKILPLKAGASELSIVRRLASEGQVDLVYSFNGALNCEPQMERFVTGLSSLLKKGGYFVCSIRNTLCLSESLSYAIVLQFGKMTPRKKQPIMVSVGGKDIPSVYYSPRSFVQFFTADFRLRKQIALPGIMPPAYLNDYYLKIRRKIAPVERLEPLFSERFPLNALGDQTLFIFQKK